MPALSKASLASIVCPSAPFLAPRLLRTYAPLAALPLQPWALPTPSRRYISDGKHLKMVQHRKRQGLKQQILHDHVALLQQFRKANTSHDLRSLMDLYPSILSTGALTRDDTRRIAQTLHACMRNPQLLGDTRTHLLSFLQQVIKDLQKGALPVHPIVYVHILGIYKERKMFDEGYALWQWVVQQDDNHVNQAVYGAAIELMAYGKKLRLPELENIYLDALKRFPGTFAEYHLSPDAIVPNRAQPTAIANLPVTLLQGILTARILNNDWKKSYLALDTALRLYPGQLPTRFFEVFMASRQLREAYTVFLVACRAGVVLKPSHVTSVMSRIKASIGRCDSLRDRIVLLRAMANASYAYLEAGGAMEPIHVGQFLTSFASLLPEPAPGRDYQGDMASLRNRIIMNAHQTLSSLLQAGMPPSPQIFTALVTLAGRLRVPDLLRVSLQDAETARVDLGEIGVRIVLDSAGRVGAKDLIEEYWKRIAHKSASDGKQIGWKDWASLARACKRANHLDYFHAQLREQEHAIPASLKDSITAVLEEEARTTEQTIDISRPEVFENELAGLNQQIKNIAAVIMSGQRLDIKKTPFYMFLDPERPPLAKREHMQEIYDEYTIDPHQPPPEKGILPTASSPTGIPLDELRFENWVSVVDLMDQAYSLEFERQSKLQRLGEDVARSERKNPLERERSDKLLSPNILRDHIKSLRDTSVGQFAIRKRYQKLIPPSLPEKAHGRNVLSDSNVEKPRSQKPLNIVKHTEGQFIFRTIDLSPDAPTPILSQTKSPRPLRQGNHNELQVLYHMFPGGGDKAVPAQSKPDDASAAAPPPKSILPGRLWSKIPKTPSLRYYASLKSDHEAPIPKPKLSRSPFGSRKSETHHSFKKYRGGLKVDDFVDKDKRSVRMDGRGEGEES
ncbi:hypothetical protein P171DRAFT_386182 [Karstenula rhodostoma CBS 690.94]|uniref:Uncharacterized protein n=1 Tax=Karstenula rhodostoma CBS 690.94 TaxID=1392251 RepID=A0A9P4PMD7_9PLEO|nr:hypothetical protein P171DRAFT_386182 [Karstenula rhodostoma CBS 690.94]